MSDLAITAEGVSKKYVIGHLSCREGYLTLRDAIARGSQALWRRTAGALRGEQLIAGSSTEEFWALKDVSFAIPEGQVVGIIGKNGAGKSTLLKVLSQITAPTDGRITIRGRVASLLEVGTGFHPELSGRENIYLNGAILGLSRADIRARFDEIIAFAEVEKFLDTPVKRYSSGMYVRLAFAVAAHLEPDIFIVDEVLAVGDAQFQKKCLGKLGEVAGKKGRTVLFVSHQMGMITSLCQRALLLDAGTVAFDGTAADAVAKYYSADGGTPFFVDYTKAAKKLGDRLATPLSASVEDAQGNRTGEIDIRQPFKVKLRYKQHEDTPLPPLPNFHFLDSLGQLAFTSNGTYQASAQPGTYEAICTVPGNFLNNDSYVIGVALTFIHAGTHVSFFDRSALSVVVTDPIEETRHGPLRNGYTGAIGGVVRPHLDWNVIRLI